MKRIFTVKSVFVVLGSLLMSVPLSAQYMSWDNMNPMDSLPVNAPWRSRDDVLEFSSIIPDPDTVGNNLLYINDFSGISRRGSFRYDWRLNEEDPNVSSDSLNGVTGITIVFRAKPTTQAIQADSFVIWWYISIRASGAPNFETDLQMYKNTLEMVGFDAYPPGGPSQYYSMPGDTNWHTWRVTQLRQDVKVYMDENPTPVIDAKTYGTDPGANHLRIGKQDRSHPYGGMFDYFLILEGKVYAPGEGPAIPDEFIVDGRPTGVRNKEADTPGILLYPNPAHDMLTVYFNNNREINPVIEIFSVTGQKVKEIHAQSRLKANVNISGLRPGIYILKTVGKYSRFVKK